MDNLPLMIYLIDTITPIKIMMFLVLFATLLFNFVHYISAAAALRPEEDKVRARFKTFKSVTIMVAFGALIATAIPTSGTVTKMLVASSAVELLKTDAAQEAGGEIGKTIMNSLKILNQYTENMLETGNGNSN